MQQRTSTANHALPAAIIAAGTIATFLIAFLIRFLSAEFTNDHFMHLAEAQQVLHGEWPVRDYFDFGLPLQVLTSAATLAWLGHNLYGEALVTVAFIAGGVALTFLTSAHLSRSLLIASGSALVALLAFPRLYNYPKAFFYVFALWLAWRYASRPTLTRLAGLGWAVALAFLYRHDHGLYIGLASIALFVVIHWSQPRAGLIAFAQYAGIILLVISPFLLFVQLTAGLAWYVADLRGPASQISVVPRVNAVPLTFDGTAEWVVVNPPAERRFNVRWAETLDQATRASLEQKYHLIRPRAEGGTTWSYVTEDEDRANIRALVDDPAVADTSGIDRGAGQLAVRELWYEWLQRRIPLLRMHVLPGVFSRSNALAFFYSITLAVPLLGLALLMVLTWRGALDRVEAAVAAMSVLLSLIVVVTLVRGSPDSRLPDIATIVCVTGAWAAGGLVRVARRRIERALAIAAVSLLWIVSVWAVGSNAHVGEALEASRLLTGPAGTSGRFDEMRTRLTRRPIETWADETTGYRALSHYAFICTEPADRVLVTWFEPIVYFYAERQFGGGHVFYDGGWHDSLRDQQFTVDRLRRQRVPIVLIRDEFELMFRKYFPLVADYVDQHYVRASAATSGEHITGYQVLVATGATPVRTYAPLGLPCFR